MSVIDGQKSTAAVFNAAFASKTTDNVLAGDNTFEEKLTLVDGKVFGADPHAFTDGQSAANMTGEVFDSSDWRAVIFEFVVMRGTTVWARGNFALFWANSVWNLEPGPYFGSGLHGLTFTFTGTTIAQLQLAASSGPGDGEVIFEKTYIPQ